MSLESFYGGKQGVSPVVKARFKYVDGNDPAYKNAINKAGSDQSKIDEINKDTMEVCFAKSDYTDVWYGQLAIIDTPNKRNKNNGKLFRRVLSRSASVAEIDGGTLHAEYIGRIVGPSEGFPKVWVGSLDEMSNKAQEVYNKNGIDYHYTFPTGVKTSGDASAIFDDEEIALTSVNDLKLKENGGEIATLKGSKKGNNQLIPGARWNENGDLISSSLEDSIRYSWVNIRNDIDDEQQDTYVYLGFQMPYTTFNFKFSDIDWKESFSASHDNRTEYLNGTHPFYQKWSIQIPRGTQGNGVGYLRQAKFSDFRNIDPDNTNKEILYRYPEDLYNSTTGKYSLRDFNSNPYNNTYKYPPAAAFEESLQDDGLVLVYTFYMYDRDYDNNLKQEVANCYFGTMNDIQGIELINNGKFIVHYSSGEDVTLNILRWIDHILMVTKDSEEYTSNTPNVIQITYNTEDENGDKEIVELGPLRLVDYMQLITNQDETARSLYVKYTDDNAPKNVFVDEEGVGTPGDFTEIDGIRIKEDTKEIQYHVNPVNKLLPGESELNKDNDGSDYRSFINPIFLNIVEQIFIGSDGHLFAKYSSSAIRYDGLNGYTSEAYQPYTRYHYYDEVNHRHWYKGGDLPDATGTSTELPEQGAWWEDLGIVEQKVNGLRIAEEFNTERYDLYCRENNLPIKDWLIDDITIENILNILNSEWLVNDINISPYENGHIYLYESGENTFINAQVKEDRIGQLVFFKGNAYYYDFGEKYNDSVSNNDLRGRRWKCAGSWSEASDSMQLKIKVGANEEIPSSQLVPIHKYGFNLWADWANKTPKFELKNIWEV